jgi:integrase/recombinase XerD
MDKSLPEGKMDSNRSHQSTAVAVNQVTVAHALETFLRLEMVGLAAQTRHWYSDRLIHLVEFLGENRALSTVMEMDLEEFIASLSSRSARYGGNSLRPKEDGALSPYTLQGYVTAARRFARWLLKKGMVEADLSEGLPRFKTPKVGKKGVEDADVDRIFDAAKDNPRDLAIVHFLYATGGRLGGVARLVLRDLNLDAADIRLRQRVSVREKGEKERTVFLSEEAQAALQGWLAVRPESEDKHVFLGRDLSGLKEAGVYWVVRRLAKKAGVTGPCSPHQWRHAFGRRMAQRRMNLGTLSQVMGHTSSKVTVDHYGQFAVDELQFAYNRAVMDKD